MIRVVSHVRGLGRPRGAQYSRSVIDLDALAPMADLPGLQLQNMPRRKTQVLDFETSHALFMCLFCLLLTAEEYRDSINGFNLDHSLAIRIGKIIDDPTLTDYVYNKYPLYPVGPGNLAQRFLMHGFFTEHLHARLERLRSGLD